MIMKDLPVFFGRLPPWSQSIVIAIYVYLIGIYFCVAEFLHDQRCLGFFRNTSGPIENIRRYKNQIHKRRKFCAEGKPCAVVTGGSGTIGIEILNLLASLGFFVISVDHKDPVGMDHDADIKHISCDMSNSEEVDMISEWIKVNTDHVEVFIAAAGAIYIPTKVETVKTNDTGVPEHQCVRRRVHMETNMCGNARLFLGIRDRMRSSIWSRTNAVFISSCVFRAARRWDQILDEQNPPMNSLTAYADSKLATNMFVMFANQMQLEADEDTIDICAVHPGVVASNLYRGALWPTAFIINRILGPFLRSGRTAARRVMEMIFSENDDNSGNYFEHEMKPVVDHCDQVFSEQLMTSIQTLLGLDADFAWA